MSDKEDQKVEQKVEQVKKVKKPNAWIEHVRNVAEDKNISYRDALKLASQTYKK